MSIAVMVEGHYSVEGLKPFADGYLTSRGTFQKYFSPHEFRSFVKSALDAEPIAVAPGIVFVFRDLETEQEFLFRRRRRSIPAELLIARSSRSRPLSVRESLPERLRPILEQFWAKAVELGRAPESDEAPETVEALSRSNVSISRAMGLCRTSFDESQLEAGARRRKDDLLVHLALDAFSRSRSFNMLPISLRRDVRHFFGNFSAAQSEARRFLLALGAAGPLEDACNSAVQSRHIYPYGDDRYHFEARQTDVEIAHRLFPKSAGGRRDSTNPSVALRPATVS